MTGLMASTGPRGTTGEREKREPEEIGAILSRWLSAKRVRERLRPDSIFECWRDIVGEEIAASSRAIKYSRGVLTVEVSSPPLLTELATYHRKGILESIRARPGFEGMQDIRFKAGGG
jgi:hypothetical protein